MATSHHHHHSHHHQYHSHHAAKNNQVAPETVAAAAAAVQAAAANQSAGAHHKGHQRRQSVARLLPDISKLRLLSWLVEASSELINCDIAIMDGVYAKLNKSQESLLFWSGHNNNSHHSHHNHQAAAVAAQQMTPSSTKRWQQTPQPPPRPSKQPVANQSLAKMISEQQKQAEQSKLKQQQQKRTKDSRLSSASRRNHHSLPLTNYDASSLAAVSLSPSLGHQPSIASSSLSAQTAPALAAAMARHSLTSTAAAAASASASTSTKPAPVINKLCDLGSSSAAAAAAAANHHQDSPSASLVICDSSNTKRHSEGEDDEEDDDGASSNAGASSTTSSSGVQGSLSSSCSDSSGSFSSSASSSSSSTSSSSASSSCSATNDQDHHQLGKSSAPLDHQHPQLSSAERLSEKIRRTVMEHQHLQNLLVNIIRQHDRLRDQLNSQRRRRQMSACDSGQLLNSRSKAPKIDLADIADALDDGCSCGCHSRRSFPSASTSTAGGQSRTLDSSSSSGVASGAGQQQQQQSKKVGKRASTLPTLLSTAPSQPTPAAPLLSNKVRRFKSKQRNTLAATGNNNNNSNPNDSEQQAAKIRQEALSQLADKLCENCFETHYWLHGCGSLDQPLIGTSSTTHRASAGTSEQSSETASDINKLLVANSSSDDDNELELMNAIVTKRNATFIKLVQQETRSTISKSIELIDLIRKEIKSPESIKHKQLMRCFSSSIQLLTSVGNYVVPSQDISAIIPEAGLQQQTQLFSLPSSDFDHLLLMNGSNFTNSSLVALSFSNQQQSSQQHSFNQLAQQLNYHLAPVPEIPIRRQINLHPRFVSNSSGSVSYQSSNTPTTTTPNSANKTQAVAATSLSLINEQDLEKLPKTTTAASSSDKTTTTITKDSSQVMSSDNNNCQASQQREQQAKETGVVVESSSGASSNNSSASSSIARGTVQQSSLTRAHTSSAILVGGGSSAAKGNHHQQHKTTSHDLSLEQFANLSRHQHHQNEDDLILPSRPRFWQSSKFNFIKKLLHVKQQRLLRQQSKDRRIYNNKVQNKFRLVMMDLTHFNKSQQLLTTENGVNSLLTSMRNVLEFGLYLTLKLY